MDIYITEQPPAPPPVKWRLVLEKEVPPANYGLGMQGLGSIAISRPETKAATPRDIAAAIDGLLSEDAGLVLDAVIARLNPQRTFDRLIQQTPTGEAMAALRKHIDHELSKAGSP